MADKKSSASMTTVGLEGSTNTTNTTGSTGSTGGGTAGASGTATNRIRINDKEYNVDDLPEEAKQLLMQIRASDQELMRHQALTSMLHTARQAYGARLEQILNQ